MKAERVIDSSYDTYVYLGDKLVELRGRDVYPLKLNMQVTLGKGMSRTFFGYGGIKQGDKVKIIDFRPAEVSLDMVKISNDKESDWVPPIFLEEGEYIPQDTQHLHRHLHVHVDRDGNPTLAKKK